MIKRLAELKSVLSGCEHLLILSHNHPDPDSLAASAALQTLVEEAFAMKATIAYDSFVGRAENRLLQKFLGRDMVLLDRIDIGGYPAVAMVDTQPGQGNNSAPLELPVSIVIDHHPPVVERTEVAFWDIRDSYGATSTILTEYLLQAEVPIDEVLATGLFYGISSETLALGRESVRADENASDLLYPLIDKRMLSRIEHADLNPAYFRELVLGLSGAVRYGPLAVAETGDIAHPELVAEVAELLLRVEGIKWSLCLGRCGEVLYLSLRTVTLIDKDAGRLIVRAINQFGRAGGHGHRAGGQVSLTDLSPEGVEAVVRKIVENFRALCPGADAEQQPLVAEAE